MLLVSVRGILPLPNFVMVQFHLSLSLVFYHRMTKHSRAADGASANTKCGQVEPDTPHVLVSSMSNHFLLHAKGNSAPRALNRRPTLSDSPISVPCYRVPVHI